MLFHTPVFGYFLVNLFSIIIAFSSNRVIIQWLILEVSILAAIPFIVYSGVKITPASSMKYFVRQAPASSLLLFSFLFSNYLNLSLLIILAILFKIALPPFQGWLVNLLIYLDSSSFFIILCLQKFIPLTILSMIDQHHNVITISLIFSFLLSLFSANRVISLPMLLFFSSVINSYWILTSLNLSSIWFEFIMFYSLFLLTFLTILSVGSFHKFNSLISSSYFFKLVVSTQLFNLAGVPPLGGFFLKLIFIENFLMLQTTIVCILLITTFLLIYLYVVFAYLIFSFTPAKIHELSLLHRVILFSSQALPLLPLIFLI